MKINKDRIKYELRRKKWTMSRLANELGMTRQGVYYLLNTPPTIKRVERLGDVLGIHFMDLLIIIDRKAA